MLQISLRFAKEYFKILREMQKTHTSEEIQSSKKLTIIQRALWTSLIIEIGRLFDTYETESKKVISFKKIFKGTQLENKINSIHGYAIISKILITRKTFTAHIDEQQENIISVAEICNSNLGELLDQLDREILGSNILGKNT